MYEMYIDTQGLMDERTARLLSKWITAYFVTANANRLIDDLTKVKRVINELSRELDEDEAD